MTVNEGAVIRYSNVLRSCKKDIDVWGNNLQLELSTSVFKVFYSNLFRLSGIDVNVRPVLSDWKSVLVDVSDTVAYIGLDLNKSFSFELAPEYSYKDDYLKYVTKGSWDAVQDVLKYYGLSKNALSADVEKAYTIMLNKECKQAEDALRGKVTSFKFRKTSYDLDKLGIDLLNLRYLPLVVFDYTDGVLYGIDSSDSTGYMMSKVSNVNSLISGDIRSQLNYFKKASWSTGACWSWGDISYKVSGERQWMVLG